MDISINHESFQSKPLSIRPAKWLSPKLLQKGEVVAGKRGKYEVRDDHGQLCAVKLTSVFFDPIPRVTIGEEDVAIAKPLAWYEYLWMGIPIVLVFIGGALGVLCGLMAVYTSSRVFRSERGVILKYVLSALVSVGYVLLFIILVTVAQLLLGTT
ncbi:MAG: hypothetical protein WD002_00750 [Pseudomonadales bacterium]